MYYIKVQLDINIGPCVKRVHSVVQLGHGQTNGLLLIQGHGCLCCGVDLCPNTSIFREGGGLDKDKAIRHLFQRLAVLLVKGIATLLVNIIPSHPLPTVNGEF